MSVIQRPVIICLLLMALPVGAAQVELRNGWTNALVLGATNADGGQWYAAPAGGSVTAVVSDTADTVASVFDTNGVWLGGSGVALVGAADLGGAVFYAGGSGAYVEKRAALSVWFWRGAGMGALLGVAAWCRTWLRRLAAGWEWRLE